MIRFFLKRLALTIPTFIALTFLTFMAIRLVPGDPVEVRVGEHGISPERLEMFRHQLGLDQPVWKQFLDYGWHLLHGDFGTSLSTSNPVLTEFLTLFPATVELSAVAMMLAIAIGIPMGVVAAVKRGTWYDQVLMGLSVTGYSMPIFWWGLLLIMLVAEQWHLTPVSGRIDLIRFDYDTPTGFMLIDSLLSDEPGAFVDAVRHLILPSIVLGTIPLAVIARMTRSSMLEVLSEDYVRTARAKGLSPFRVIGVHALRNALIPVTTVIGLMTGSLLAGAVLTESIFSWPGVGHYLIEAISRRDYPALQGGIMLVSAVVILVNLLVDTTYGLINPRIRHGR
ncbi:MULTISPECIES: ABC transporter permease subunit [Lichenihabitans]|uniref:ABC transporter permease subunit n=1 Tax=Lichenihabitans TaxID=2723776 RepID=UPI0010356D37|nr:MULTISPECIES: ABC transporter permease subunit [Lichenihabitans]UDL96033.1 ABC transporter permease subunit [Lichenihabitans sp. PAMC28606]